MARISFILVLSMRHSVRDLSNCIDEIDASTVMSGCWVTSLSALAAPSLKLSPSFAGPDVVTFEVDLMPSADSLGDAPKPTMDKISSNLPFFTFSARQPCSFF